MLVVFHVTGHVPVQRGVLLGIAAGLGFGISDRLGDDPVVIGVRITAFALILVGAAMIPAPVRAGEALNKAAVQADIRTRPA